ncbi:MAG TPA: ammonia-forming cytochrome c nitrite reductase subunit c552 [Xanthomonadales bacterium]|nr:ammonia-forming cytochrome c nitrite reductase subunit c552 [Xanthomonadales bacterium]
MNLNGNIGITLLMFAAVLVISPGRADTQSAYLGSETCKGCHAQEWNNWRSSHHYQAMLPASAETVLGDFDDAEFEYAGRVHRFYKRDGRFWVETDNAAGEFQEFEINYIFGFFPLQQYLIGFPDGRYQALSIAWDSRPQDAGGQRWYHLYPDETIRHDDILHWTGSFQNWNSRCAACHSTQLRKNYSTTDNTYATQWAEINVACEACHGPGGAHVSWAAGERKAAADPGFSNTLGGASAFVVDGDKPTRRRLEPGNAHAQLEVCAACHSRRTELNEDHAGQSYADLFQLRLLEEDMYFADGQVRDEAYVYGSFLQSRMYQAGVSCTNCHEPHSGAVLAQGNALCAQCHQPAVFDTPVHHHHATNDRGADSSGAACVNCHMPSTTYMGVDDRRDHSFRVPEPQLTLELGIPNACNRCHQEQDAAWSVRAMQQWYPQAKLRAAHATVLAAARQGRRDAMPGLMALANDPSRPGILRATAVLESTRFPSRESLALIQSQLGADDPLIRAAATQSLEWLPAVNRYSLLAPLITDPAKSVRMAVAPMLADLMLADLPPDQLPAKGRDGLLALRAEYLEALRLNADMPESLLNLGSFLAMSGQAEEAERAYRQALKLAPDFVPAMINLADLYRAAGLDDAATPLLQSAIEAAPDMAAAYHSMGLLLVRQKQMDQAVRQFRKAAELEPRNARYAYVYAVALYEQGQQQQAVSILEQSLSQHPGDPELISALRAYYQKLGELEKLQVLEASQPR